MFQMWRQKSVPGNKYLISNVLKISRPLILHEKALGPTNSRKISLFSTENISRKYLHVIFPHGACTNYLLRIIRMRKLYMVFILQNDSQEFVCAYVEESIYFRTQPSRYHVYAHFLSEGVADILNIYFSLIVSIIWLV